MADEHEALTWVRFTWIAQHEALTLSVALELFPQQTFYALSDDQRRIVSHEVSALLVQSRAKIQSQAFHEYMAMGAKPSEVKDDPAPGQYV